MLIGILIDFLITFLICLIILLCIRPWNRPSFKTVLKVVGLGALSIIVTLILGDLFKLLYLYIYGLFGVFIKESIFVNIIENTFIIFAFAALEEIAKYFLFNYLWNNGDIQMKSPLQTTLVFVIVGATFSFIEDVKYIVEGASAWARIITIISGHLCYALLFSLFFTKEVVRSRCSYMMEDNLVKLKRNPKYYNKYIIDKKYLLKGLLISTTFHFIHNFLIELTSITFIFSYLFYALIIVLTLFFIIKIIIMFKKDYSYNMLAERQISIDYPDIEKELESINKVVK